MSLRRRLLGNGIASAGSIFWTALAQLLSVPILTQAWGLEGYGQWLMIVTIPTYFALSDFGFTSAATAEMTMAFANGDRFKLIEVLQSVWALMVIVCLSLFLVASPLLYFNHFSESYGWLGQNALVLFIFVLYSCAVILSRVVLAALRSSGNYSVGTLFYDAIQFLEVGLALCLAVLGRGFLECAFAYLLVRCLNIAVCYVLLRRVTPWINLGFQSATTSEMRRLFKPALAALAIPTALSLNLQGMIIIAGYAVGPSLVAILSPVRTASRITIQVIGIFNRASMPEFSSALARNDIPSIKKILKLNLKVVALVLTPGALAFALLGDSLVMVWSAGNISAKTEFVALIALSMFLHGVWFFGSNLLVAVGRHGVFGRRLLPISFLAMAITFPLAMRFGDIGLGWGVVLSEALVVLLVYPELVGNFRKYLRA